MNYKDIPKTEYGKEQAISISRQLGSWIKTLSEKEQDSYLSFLGLDESVKEFEFHMINKYKGKQKNEWTNKFRREDFVCAVRDILKAKIYEHKGERELFMSGHAHNHYQTYQLFKNSRRVAHESAGRLNKVLKANGDYSFSNRDLQMLVAKTVEQVISKRMQNYLPQREQTLLN